MSVMVLESLDNLGLFVTRRAKCNILSLNLIMLLCLLAELLLKFADSLSLFGSKQSLLLNDSLINSCITFLRTRFSDLVSHKRRVGIAGHHGMLIMIKRRTGRWSTLNCSCHWQSAMVVHLLNYSVVVVVDIVIDESCVIFPVLEGGRRGMLGRSRSLFLSDNILLLLILWVL